LVGTRDGKGLKAMHKSKAIHETTRSITNNYLRVGSCGFVDDLFGAPGHSKI